MSIRFKKGKQGFTLVELIVVVIVIGILATVAVPQYLKATERAKLGKARNAMALIAQGEKLYRADMDTYINTALDANNAVLGPYVELVDVDADPDWSYQVGGASATAFTVTATRTGGSNNGESITLNQAGTWNMAGFTP